MQMKTRFSNKIAVISGAAAGIGKAIACRLGKEGATLALFDMNKSLLQKTVLELKKNGIKSKGYLIDISDEKQVCKAMSQVEKDFLKIEIL